MSERPAPTEAQPGAQPNVEPEPSDDFDDLQCGAVCDTAGKCVGVCVRKPGHAGEHRKVHLATIPFNAHGDLHPGAHRDAPSAPAAASEASDPVEAAFKAVTDILHPLSRVHQRRDLAHIADQAATIARLTGERDAALAREQEQAATIATQAAEIARLEERAAKFTMTTAMGNATVARRDEEARRYVKAATATYLLARAEADATIATLTRERDEARAAGQEWSGLEDDMRKERDEARTLVERERKGQEWFAKELLRVAAALGLDGKATVSDMCAKGEFLVLECDGWKREHDNALACWRTDNDTLLKSRDTLLKSRDDARARAAAAEREVERLTHVTSGMPGRDWLGSIVREVWDVWARKQPNPKSSWLTPWKQLAEPDREVDRQIGETLFKLGAEAVQFQARKARAQAEAAERDAEACRGVLREVTAALCDYVKVNSLEHDDPDCPQDDTCECVVFGRLSRTLDAALKEEK